MSNNNTDQNYDESGNIDQTKEYSDEILNLIEESDAAHVLGMILFLAICFLIKGPTYGVL